MAEELAPEAGEDGASAPLETSSEQQPNPIEELAVKLGWSPRDQFRGDDAEWKPADEFILASRDINRTLSRELRGVREEVSRMGRVSSQILADKLAEQESELRGAHRRAVEEGDIQAAERAVDDLSKLKAAAPTADQEPPETLAFKEKHKAWFGTNRLATGRAVEVAERSRQLGATPVQQLEDAEAAIRREFPELFPAPAKAAPSVQTATSRNAGNGSGKKGFADMPQASQDMARDYLARHGVPLEKFAESYWQQNQERKVG